MKRFLCCLSGILALLSIFSNASFAQPQRAVQYPYPVKFLDLEIESTPVKMAYMDVAPARPNGRNVILFHGKNFNGYYWKDVARGLAERGFRVVVPDQIGWGKSSKPDIHYSFHQLAADSRKLLDHLGIKKTIVLGHSMGGMLAARFALMYGDTVEKLILENPIGLEDYRTFVPFSSFDELYKTESAATYESYRNYQKTYYPEWKPEYEQYVAAQAEPLLDRTNFPNVARANALTSLMIYEQPVVYEFENISQPTLLIIGLEDRTVVGKARLPKAEQNKYGQYPQLGKKINAAIKGSKLVELAGVGHIPHLQTPDRFEKALLDFIEK